MVCFARQRYEMQDLNKTTKYSNFKRTSEQISALKFRVHYCVLSAFVRHFSLIFMLEILPSLPEMQQRPQQLHFLLILLNKTI